MNTLTSPFAWKFVSAATEECFIGELKELNALMASALESPCRLLTGADSNEDAISYIRKNVEGLAAFKDGRLPALSFVVADEALRQTGTIVTCSWTAIPFLELAQRKGYADHTARLIKKFKESGFFSHFHVDGKWSGRPAQLYVQLKGEKSRGAWDKLHTSFSNAPSLVDFSEWNRLLASRFPPEVTIEQSEVWHFIKQVEDVLADRRLR